MKNNYLKKIRGIRKKLHKAISKYGLNSEETRKLSDDIDKKINEYYKSIEQIKYPKNSKMYEYKQKSYNAIKEITIKNRKFPTVKQWNKIAKEASKQCGRQKIPKVIEPMNFKNMIENISKYDIVLLLYENEKSITIKQVLQKLKKEGKKAYKIAIIIGPEGGFSKEEVSKLSEVENVQVVTVGARILRTETAGVVAMAMLNYEFEL